MEKLGIIAGGGLLPVEIANIYASIGGECVVASIGEKQYLNLINNKFLVSSFEIGQVGHIIDFFKTSNVNRIILVGGVVRPNLKSLKVDKLGSILITKILKNKLLGDNNLLVVVAKFIEQQGFEVIAGQEILALKPQSGFITKISPNKQDKIDIEIGFEIANALGVLDIGQSVIIEEGYILGVEAAEGTDNLIKRCSILRKKKNGAILVKVMKPNQDFRLDIPTIGERTIDLLAEYSYRGVAVKNNQIIILDQSMVYAKANKYGLFISIS